MPATFTAHDDQIDIRFEWSLDADLAQEIVFGSALYRWRRGEGPTTVINPGTPEEETVQKPWASLSNQEKLDMVYRGAGALIKAEARTALVDTGTEAARETANEYADGNYDLPE